MLFLNLRLLFLLILTNYVDDGSLVTSPSLHPGVRVVVVKGIELVVFLLGNGIVLVRMTLGALHGESHPDVARRLHPVHYVFHPILLGNHSTFIGGGVVSIEARGNLLV